MKIKINKKSARESKALKTGIDRYINIMADVDGTSFDSDFKKKYNVFYRISPHRDETWQKSYYRIFKKYRIKRNSNENFTLRDVLTDIYKATGRVEFSFASKLMHSLCPKKYPIYDSILADKFSLEKVKGSGENKIDCACNVYNELCDKVIEHEYLVKDFDDIFSIEANYKKISKIKKIDFLIWWSGHFKN